MEEEVVIFFGFMLVCAVMFILGYLMGERKNKSGSDSPSLRYSELQDLMARAITEGTAPLGRQLHSLDQRMRAIEGTWPEEGISRTSERPRLAVHQDDLQSAKQTLETRVGGRPESRGRID